jgi:hypothetical protein
MLFYFSTKQEQGQLLGFDNYFNQTGARPPVRFWTTSTKQEQGQLLGFVIISTKQEQGHLLGFVLSQPNWSKASCQVL